MKKNPKNNDPIFTPIDPLTEGQYCPRCFEDISEADARKWVLNCKGCGAKIHYFNVSDEVKLILIPTVQDLEYMNDFPHLFDEEVINQAKGNREKYDEYLGSQNTWRDTKGTLKEYL